MTKKVQAVFKFPNGMIATIGYDNQQIPELQGADTPELRRKLAKAIDDDTELNGITRSNL